VGFVAAWYPPSAVFPAQAPALETIAVQGQQDIDELFFHAD